MKVNGCLNRRYIQINFTDEVMNRVVVVVVGARCTLVGFRTAIGAHLNCSFEIHVMKTLQERGDDRLLTCRKDL